jgi:hypothetical protein
VVRALLRPFVDHRGLRHPRGEVRARAGYLLLRWLSAQALLAPSLTALFAPDLLLSLSPFLALEVQPGRGRSLGGGPGTARGGEGGEGEEGALEDALQEDLFEAAGLLVFALRDRPEEHRAQLGGVLGPLYAACSEVLARGLFLLDSPEDPAYASFLLRSLSAVARFSKGWRSCTEAGQGAFVEFLQLDLQVLRALPQHDEVRAKVTFFLHRMVDLIGEAVGPYLEEVLPCLADCQTPQGLLALVRLLGQLAQRFRLRAAPLLQAVLLPLLAAAFGFFQPARAEQFEPAQLEELQRGLFVFLGTAAPFGLSACLTAPPNLPHLGSVVQMLTEAATGQSTNRLAVRSPL